MLMEPCVGSQSKADLKQLDDRSSQDNLGGELTNTIFYQYSRTYCLIKQEENPQGSDCKSLMWTRSNARNLTGNESAWLPPCCKGKKKCTSPFAGVACFLLHTNSAVLAGAVELGLSPFPLHLHWRGVAA